MLGSAWPDGHSTRPGKIGITSSNPGSGGGFLPPVPSLRVVDSGSSPSDETQNRARVHYRCADFKGYPERRNVIGPVDNNNRLDVNGIFFFFFLKEKSTLSQIFPCLFVCFFPVDLWSSLFVCLFFNQHLKVTKTRP